MTNDREMWLTSMCYGSIHGDPQSGKHHKIDGIGGDTYQPKYLSKYITNFHPYKKLKYARTVLNFMHKQWRSNPMHVTITEICLSVI